MDTISKSNFIITNHLIDFLNASIVYSFVPTWGYFMKNISKWSGMIGDLIENRSDIGATALFFTSDRIKLVEYVSMVTPTRSKFVFRSPKLSFTDDVFVLPFDIFVWYSIICLVIVSSTVLLFTNFLDIKSRKHGTGVNSKILFWEMLSLTLGAACQQGTSVNIKNVAGKIMTFIIFLALMFLYVSYSAAIVALLQSPSNRINTLEDLLSSRLKMGADDTVFNHYYFSVSRKTF